MIRAMAMVAVSPGIAPSIVPTTTPRARDKKMDGVNSTVAKPPNNNSNISPPPI